ncbi:MAG TPA: DUF1992 domain-containing protein [Nocardioidaceae bacterium]|nr:DUF1992 domain-containing protein [Nocardioidaceae bacterium]
MPEQESRIDRERRLRQAALTAAARQPPEPAEPEEEPEDDADPALRMQQQALWVDLQVKRAMARGDFDNLPGAGKPLKLPDRHDPDWWVKGLIEREQITGVLPPALALRRDDAGLDAELDRETTPDGVRRVVDEFNHRVVEARRQLQGGPPVITPTRDPEQEVTAWAERRAARREQQRRQLDELSASSADEGRPRWWRRKRRHGTDSS